MEQEQKNQTVADDALVRDEGVGGSNPLTPTMERAAKLFQPAQALAQDRYTFSRATIVIRAKDGICEAESPNCGGYAELHGYSIHERGRGNEHPIAFAGVAVDAEKIVAALNRAAS